MEGLRELTLRFRVGQQNAVDRQSIASAYLMSDVEIEHLRPENRQAVAQSVVYHLFDDLRPTAVEHMMEVLWGGEDDGEDAESPAHAQEQEPLVRVRSPVRSGPAAPPNPQKTSAFPPDRANGSDQNDARTRNPVGGGKVGKLWGRVRDWFAGRAP